MWEGGEGGGGRKRPTGYDEPVYLLGLDEPT